MFYVICRSAIFEITSDCLTMRLLCEEFHLSIPLQHYKEAACHQLAIEELLHDAGVDLVFTGGEHLFALIQRSLAPVHKLFKA